MSEIDLTKCQQSDQHIAERMRELVSEWAGASIAYRMELKRLYAEAGQIKSELAKLQAEREPIDNGDGTVTKLLPVTFPKGLDVIGVRSRKAGDMFAHWNGVRAAVDRDGDPENVWLILRPAPKPPEPVTWEAPLCDGEWIAWQDYAEFIGNRRQWFVWFGTVRGLERPAKLGRYGFASGVGALVEEYGNV